MARCSICYTMIKDAEAKVTCPECTQDYHHTCWTEIGGCGTYGCKQAAVAQKPPVPVLVGQGWGDTKECPSCRVQIGSSLLVCGCGARFPWADPMTATDYLQWTGDQQALASARTLLIWMFILSLLVVISPVTGAIGGIFAFVKRKKLAGSGGPYLAMGYGSAAIGAIFTLLIILVSVGK
jgi:hypothetical protein